MCRMTYEMLNTKITFFMYNFQVRPKLALDPSVMGIGFSSVDVLDICKEEMEASQKCMKQYNYSREEYARGCREFFQRYRDCKKKCV